MSYTIYEKSAGGSVYVAARKTREQARRVLCEKADAIRRKSTNEKNSYRVTRQAADCVTVGVIGGNSCAIRLVIVETP